MRNTRRNFILGTGAALVGSALERIAADVVPIAPAPDIRALLQSSGFDPDNPNSALLAVLGDVHINLNTNDSKYTDRFDDRLVAELNGLTPAITDLAIAGDLIIHHSVSIGGNRYPNDYEMSRQEFRTAKAQIARFRADMRFYAVPGNHDTDRFEIDAELWREELQLPPYQKKILGGVPVFFLNSGHAGMPDPAQRAWFEEQIQLISPNQEVVIVAHHPSFFYLWGESGLKKIVFQAFSTHRAPVWIVGGHGHSFGEQLYVAGSARFIQMEVTTGNPKLSGDGRNPGYVLLALQDGRVVQRHFRSINEPGFQTRAPLDQITSAPVQWAFDRVEFPAKIFNEGFYNRSGTLIGFDGIDLKSHFVGCRSHTVRVNLGAANGKITEYSMAAYIGTGYAPPTCEFSTTGVDGSWVSSSFPSSAGHQVYRVSIPIQFRNAASLYIRTKTQLQGPNDGIEVFGWCLAADASVLTGYEKWLSAHYRTFLQNDQTSPTSTPVGSKMTNIEHYAFNIPLPSSGSAAPSAIIPPDTPPPILGTPTYSRTFRNITSFQFARRTADSNPMVTYRVERSNDLSHWTPVNEDQLAITRLNSEWEEVCLNFPMLEGISGYFRVGVSPQQGTPGGSSYISAGDLDANGIDDLVQYAFDLQQQTGLARAYDPERTEHVAGLPVQKRHQGLCSTLRYARLQKSANPGVNYRIEETSDLNRWITIPDRFITERIIRTNSDWEDVEAILMDSIHPNRFYRVALDLTEPLPS